MNIFKSNHSSRKGFTLVELLVVIGILAVLAAIAIPSVAGLIEKGNVSTDTQNANEMSNAIERWVGEYEVYIAEVNAGTVDSQDPVAGRVENTIKTVDADFDATDRDVVKLFEKGVDVYAESETVGSVDYRTKYPTSEAMVMDAVNRYTSEEAKQIAEMFALVVMSLTQRSNQDFLGETFSALALHNEWKGQFFTPYHVGAFMAAVNIEPAKDQLNNKDIITVSDCCCGAGCLLIAFANEAMKAHMDFQNKVLFIAQDLDYVAALMYYIQLSLLGCKAIVKTGNSLTDPFVEGDMECDSVWLTPMYTHADTFRLMRIMETIFDLTNQIESDKDSEQPTAGAEKASA